MFIVSSLLLLTENGLLYLWITLIDIIKDKCSVSVVVTDL